MNMRAGQDIERLVALAARRGDAETRRHGEKPGPIRIAASGRLYVPASSSGIILLEVILSLALFVSAAGVAIGAFNWSAQACGQMRLEAKAADLAVSVLSEIQMGLLPVGDSPAKNFQEPMQNWTWQVVTTTLQDDTMGPQSKQVEIIVNNTQENYTYHLVEVMPEDSTTAPPAAPAVSPTAVLPLKAPGGQSPNRELPFSLSPCFLACYARAPRRAPKRASRRGMTLLEVIVGMGLALALIGAILAFYEQATQSRQMLMAKMDEISSQRHVMERLTDELRQSLAVPFINLGMTGSGDTPGQDRIKFAIANLPDASAWNAWTSVSGSVSMSTSQPAGPVPQQDVQLVIYDLQTYTDDTGQLQIAGLERSCQKVLGIQTAQVGTDVIVSLVTPNIKFFHLRYWDPKGNAWVSSWSSAAMPCAVEVTIGAQPLPQGGDPDKYPYDMFRRVISLPTAKKVTGTVIQEPL
jgi:hypothetical protein